MRPFILVPAIFIGENGSRGFAKGATYQLEFWIKPATVAEIHINNSHGPQTCVYASLAAFVANWNLI